MKKRIISLASILSLAVLSVNAQTPSTTPSTTSSSSGGVTFGIRAGVNFQNLTGEIGNEDTDGKLKTGFHAGVDVAFPVAPEFYLQSGLLYSQKGAKFDGDGSDDVKLNLGYLELPINFVYKPMLGSGNLILGAGPYIAYGLGGKIKSGDTKGDVKFKNDITLDELSDIGDGAAFFAKKLDFGGNILFGYEFSNKLFIQLNAQLGMVNIFPKVAGQSVDNTSVKNTGFGASIGFNF